MSGPRCVSRGVIMNDNACSKSALMKPAALIALVLAVAEMLVVLPALAWDLPFHGKETLTGDSRLNREISRERSYQRNTSKDRFICEQVQPQRRIKNNGRR